MRKLFLSLSLAFIFACSSDRPESSEPIPSEGNLLKTEKTYFFGSLEKELNYFYNSDGTISKVDVNSVYEGVGSFEYFYNDNGRMESWNLTLTSPFGDLREENATLIYEGDLIMQNCIVVSVTGEDGEIDVDSAVNKVEYEYNENGFVTKVTTYYDSSLQTSTCEDLESINSIIDMQYDSKGNLIRMENSENILGSNYLTYTHDDTFHPYRNLKPVNFRNIYNYSSANNVISGEEFDSDSNEKVGYIEYKYEYNEENYPVWLEKKWSTADDLIFQTYTYEFSYY